MKTLLSIGTAISIAVCAEAQSYHGTFNGNGVITNSIRSISVYTTQGSNVISTSGGYYASAGAFGGTLLQSAAGTRYWTSGAQLASSTGFMQDYQGYVWMDTNGAVNFKAFTLGNGTSGGFVDANGNVVITNNTQTITSIRTPGGAIFYSNAPNAGVVSSPSSVTIVAGMPNNPFVFATNDNFYISAIANHTNGWGGGFALMITNQNASPITVTFGAFSSITTNGVDCPSGVIPILAGKVLDLAGSVGVGVEPNQLFTNFYGLLKNSF